MIVSELRTALIIEHNGMGNNSEGPAIRQVKIGRGLYQSHHEADHPLFGRCRFFYNREVNQWLCSKVLRFPSRDESELIMCRLHDSIESPVPGFLKIEYVTPANEEASCSSMCSKLVVWFEPTDGSLE